MGKEEKEEVTLICGTFKTPNSIGEGNCASCNTKVWYSDDYSDKKVTTVCSDCAYKYVKDLPPDDITLPPWAEKTPELIEFLKTKLKNSHQKKYN